MTKSGRKKETTIYRQGGEIEIKPFKEILDGEQVLPGFTLDLAKIFEED